MGRDQIGMLCRRDTPVIRQARKLPRASPRAPVGRQVDDLRIARQMLQRLLVDGRQGARQARSRGAGVSRTCPQRVEEKSNLSCAIAGL